MVRFQKQCITRDHTLLVQAAHTRSAVPLGMGDAGDGHVRVDGALHVSLLGRAMVVLVALSQLTAGAV